MRRWRARKRSADVLTTVHRSSGTPASSHWRWYCVNWVKVAVFLQSYAVLASVVHVSWC